MHNRSLAVLAFLVWLTALTVTVSTVVADSDQNVGILKVSVKHPNFVSPSSQVSLLIDNNYAVHDNATLKTRLFNGTLYHLGAELWHSDPDFISGPILGEQILAVNLTAPANDGKWALAAVTYFQNVGKYHYNDTTTNDTSAWSYYNDTEYGPSFLQFTVEISKPAQLAVDLGISNVPIQTDDSITKTASNGTALLPFHVGENVTISVPQVLPLQNLTRLVFQGWQDGGNSTERSVLLNGNIRVKGFYQPQYLLQVNSVVPAYTQSTWHNPGSSVTLKTATSAPMNWPLGSLGLRYNFKGWTGDVTSSSIRLSLVMDKPKVIRANFTPDLTPLTLPSILLAGVVGGVSLTIVQRRSVANASPIETDSEDNETKQGSEKLCASCGRPTKESWAYCIKCGKNLGETSKSAPSRRSRRRSKH
jgi:hypothetical protein